MESIFTVYLGGAIAGCTNDECKAWRDRFKTLWVDCIDPMRRDYRHPGDDEKYYREIVEQDKRDIRNSDVLLVRYIKPSVGTSMEILYAWQHEKLILIWCDEGAVLSPWLLYHNTAIVYSEQEVLDKLDEWSLD